MRFLVIGCGASGLATAKILLEADPSRDVVIVDQGCELGGTYVNKSYEDAHLVSSKVCNGLQSFRDGPILMEISII